MDQLIDNIIYIKLTSPKTDGGIFKQYYCSTEYLPYFIENGIDSYFTKCDFKIVQDNVDEILIFKPTIMVTKKVSGFLSGSIEVQTPTLDIIREEFAKRGKMMLATYYNVKIEDSEQHGDSNYGPVYSKTTSENYDGDDLLWKSKGGFIKIFIFKQVLTQSSALVKERDELHKKVLESENKILQLKAIINNIEEYLHRIQENKVKEKEYKEQIAERDEKIKELTEEVKLAEKCGELETKLELLRTKRELQKLKNRQMII